MFYEEIVIEGELYYRTDPKGTWLKMSPIRMTNEILNLREKIRQMQVIIDEEAPRLFMEK